MIGDIKKVFSSNISLIFKNCIIGHFLFPRRLVHIIYGNYMHIYSNFKRFYLSPLNQNIRIYLNL